MVANGASDLARSGWGVRSVPMVAGLWLSVRLHISDSLSQANGVGRALAVGSGIPVLSGQ